MTLPAGLTVVESPKTMLKGTSRAYGIDFSNIGEPTDVGDTFAFDSDGVSANDMLSGTASQAGSIITLEEFTPTAAGQYRIIHQTDVLAQDIYGIVDVAVFDAVPPSAADKTLAVGAYSSLVEVAAIVPRRANSVGTFDDTTRPTATRLIVMMNQVSLQVDSILATVGFDVPVTDAGAKPLIDFFVGQEIATMVEGINGAGRFGPSKKTNSSRFSLLMNDIQ